MPSPFSRNSNSQSSLYTQKQNPLPTYNSQEDPLFSKRFQSGKGHGFDTVGARVERRSLNGTAYRIFKLLEWLIEEPLTLEKLNTRFLAEPLIGKAVSDDSVWLYVNTLKLLGCRIRRPSPKNGFCYELLSHPFASSLTEAQQEMLIIAKTYAQKSFNYREMLILDSLLKKITQHYIMPLSQTTTDTLLDKNEAYTLETCADHVRLLEQNIPADKLFLLHYRSPLSGEAEFYFLPEMLYYDQGVLFVHGERSDRLTSSSFRLDWVISLRLVEHPALREELRQRRSRHVTVQLRLYVSNPAIWNGLNLDVRHGIYAETFEKKHSSGQIHIDIELQVRDFLHLKQKLLSSTSGFQVLQGEGFRQDLYDTLQRMDKLYRTSTLQST
jgi:hypothetical protein